jgi:hypothetical protein
MKTSVRVANVTSEIRSGHHPIMNLNFYRNTNFFGESNCVFTSAVRPEKADIVVNYNICACF